MRDARYACCRDDIWPAFSSAARRCYAQRERLVYESTERRLQCFSATVGGLERTLFTLDWINDPDLRRSTGQELNKGEACNTLARTVLKSEQFVLSGQAGHHVGGMFSTVVSGRWHMRDPNDASAGYGYGCVGVRN
jgi:Tn3 transposase DDE domain